MRPTAAQYPHGWTGGHDEGRDHEQLDAHASGRDTPKMRVLVACVAVVCLALASGCSKTPRAPRPTTATNTVHSTVPRPALTPISDATTQVAGRPLDARSSRIALAAAHQVINQEHAGPISDGWPSEVISVSGMTYDGTVPYPNTGTPCTSRTLIAVRILGKFGFYGDAAVGPSPSDVKRPLDVSAVEITADSQTEHVCDVAAANFFAPPTSYLTSLFTRRG